MLIYRKNDAKNYKEAYGLKIKDEIIFEGTCLEALFIVLRMRKEMEELERVQVNLMIYECFKFYPDIEIEDEEARAEAVATAVVATARLRTARS